MSILDKTIEAISAQQGPENGMVFAVGEHLKDILRNQPECAELVLQDLEKKSMTISKCEKQIKTLADAKHKLNGGEGAGVTMAEAEKIIRKFYGLPERGQMPEPATKVGGNVVDLGAFF